MKLKDSPVHHTRIMLHKAVASLLFLIVFSVAVLAQKPPSEKDLAAADDHFNKANAHFEKKDFAAALASYQAALKILPDEPALLYNGGFAALLVNDNQTAVELWTRMKKFEPDDWALRAKLVQAFQRLNRIADRDREREEIFALRKSGRNKELTEQVEYCRDRFEAGGRSVLAFELFEFKGPRAIRYVFSVMDTKGEEDYRISLGSYDLTNNIWRETTKPKPKDGLRLFHLDGYFRGGGHATYGMMPGEPSYEETKKMVTDILEKRAKPISATVPSSKP